MVEHKDAVLWLRPYDLMLRHETLYEVIKVPLLYHFQTHFKLFLFVADVIVPGVEKGV
jgi:hypothetical protein